MRNAECEIRNAEFVMRNFPKYVNIVSPSNFYLLNFRKYRKLLTAQGYRKYSNCCLLHSNFFFLSLLQKNNRLWDRNFQ